MITSPVFAGKRYAVLGLARSGAATVRALLHSGAEVLFWDDNPETLEPLVRQLKEDRSEHAPFRYKWTNWLLAKDLTGFDAIVVSPGVPLNRHPVKAKAECYGIPIIGDIELFALARPSLPPHKVVGITGTNGKSTTTALIHHILETAGVPTTMGGNIGLPILSQEPLPEGGVYVLELSSYQIDLTFSLDCDVAVLTNITPDHLDRYDGFDAYAASKLRLFEMMREPHIGVFHHKESDRALFERVNAIRPWRIWSNYDDNAEDPYELWGAFDKEGWTASRDHLSTQKDWPSLQGPHNAQNTIAAILACSALKVPERLVSEALRTYPGLPHRMERVAERAGVLFVNDSKATNATATAPALAAYPVIHWILGGLPKSDDLDDCAPHFDHVRAGYTIGEAGPMFANILRDAGKPVTESGTLAQAVRDAAAAAQAGEVVMLSPACASFDQFRDYEARGQAFRDAVAAL